jgi:hypothetical protein
MFVSIAVRTGRLLQRFRELEHQRGLAGNWLQHRLVHREFSNLRAAYTARDFDLTIHGPNCRQSRAERPQAVMPRQLRLPARISQPPRPSRMLLLLRQPPRPLAAWFVSESKAFAKARAIASPLPRGFPALQLHTRRPPSAISTLASLLSSVKARTLAVE